MISINAQNEVQLVDNSFYELASFYDVVKSIFPGAWVYYFDINKFYKWLCNPYHYRKELIKMSSYFYHRDGIVTDCYDTFKSLPILSYSILWDNMQQKSFQSKKKIIDDFIRRINVVKLARDTIFQVMNEGTCVWYNRDNKFIQFLEPEQYVIEFMRNGKWQVYYDLNYIYEYYGKSSMLQIEQVIEAAPDEVTLDKYVRYRNKKTKEYQYVPLDIKKTQVIKFRGSRNNPYALPYCIPALPSIIHKDLLERTERAVADRIINQIIVQKVGNIPDSTGKGTMPAPPELRTELHNNLKNLLMKKYNGQSGENSSVAPLTIPDFVTLEELKVNVNIFNKDVYERIDRAIFNKLGYSQSLGSGGGTGQSYGSATINSEKVSSFIFAIIEQVEDGLNEYMSYLVPSGTFNPKIRFSRVTYLNQDKEFERAEALYLKGRGSLKDYVEASGRDFDYFISQARYENEVLKLDEILPVHNTSFTSSGDNQGGRPKDPNSKNDNTDKSKGNGGNMIPSPSDG
mgnify:CR=1 FL=1